MMSAFRVSSSVFSSAGTLPSKSWNGASPVPSFSSVYKGLDVAVKDAITAAKDGSFSNDPYVGTLENEGTGLAPFHDFDGKVPAELKTELDTLKADIISGKIKIESKSQPSA